MFLQAVREQPAEEVKLAAVVKPEEEQQQKRQEEAAMRVAVCQAQELQVLVLLVVKQQVPLAEERLVQDQIQVKEQQESVLALSLEQSVLQG
jgi:hypothetical protein